MLLRRPQDPAGGSRRPQRGWTAPLGGCCSHHQVARSEAALGRFWSVSEPAPKTCVVCGRIMQWRKKWERSWDEVRYCSTACRRRGVQSVDHELESAIVELLSGRPRGTSICPNDAARVVGGAEWEQFAEPARAAARRLTAAGRTEITQAGRVVDPSTAKGPIRIRLT